MAEGHGIPGSCASLKPGSERRESKNSESIGVSRTFKPAGCGVDSNCFTFLRIRVFVLVAATEIK